MGPRAIPASYIFSTHIHEDVVNAFSLFLRLLLIYSHILKLVKFIENTIFFNNLYCYYKIILHINKNLYIFILQIYSCSIIVGI